MDKLQMEDMILEYILLIVEMRDKQKEYFRTRDRDILIRSKELEKTVDAESARISNFIKSGKC